jgi:hypothetical protein
LLPFFSLATFLLPLLLFFSVASFLFLLPRYFPVAQFLLHCFLSSPFASFLPSSLLLVFHSFFSLAFFLCIMLPYFSSCLISSFLASHLLGVATFFSFNSFSTDLTYYDLATVQPIKTIIDIRYTASSHAMKQQFAEQNWLLLLVYLKLRIFLTKML